MKDLISIIVPIYNVEAYIDRCVESLVKQTYSNIEIILVDDGSTDRSVEKCEKWLKQDSRIKIVQRSNGGAAAARNTGLEQAQGEYVMFVDSDDYVSYTICEKLYEKIKEEQADIAICRMKKIEPTREYATRPFEYDGSQMIFTNIEALKEYFLDKIDCGPCHKLFSRKKLGNLRFPEGVINEDFVFVYKALFQAQKIIFVEDILYYYCFRENSVTSSKFDRRQFAKYYNCIDMMEYVHSYIKEVIPEATFYLWRQTFYLLKYLVLNNETNVYKMEFKAMKNTLRKGSIGILICKWIPLKEKISYCFVGWAPKLYYMLHK